MNKQTTESPKAMPQGDQAREAAKLLDYATGKLKRMRQAILDSEDYPHLEALSHVEKHLTDVENIAADAFYGKGKGARGLG